MTEIQARQKIVEICQLLHSKNWLAAADGNLSYRLNEEQFLITPSGRAKAFMQAEDIVVLSKSGDLGAEKASSEKAMHMAVMQSCAKAKVVIHAHPPTAVAWSIARPQWKELPAYGISELILALGSVPIVPYARPGTEQMGTVLLPYLPKSRALILARHGVLAWGECFEEALNGVERIEHSAEVLFRAAQLGDLTSLPPAEISYLKSMREKMGDRSL